MNHAFQISIFFFFNDTATTEIYTLSLHDALPICCCFSSSSARSLSEPFTRGSIFTSSGSLDRKSTRLNSSHGYISYAVFCLKKKQKQAHSPLHPTQYITPRAELCVTSNIVRNRAL